MFLLHTYFQLVNKVKANYLIDQISLWNMDRLDRGDPQQMVTQLWNCLETITVSWQGFARHFMTRTKPGF